MKNQQRLIRQMIQRQGLDLIKITTTSSNIKARVRAPDGRVQTLMAAKTPSDHRAAKNNEAWLRRFAKGQYPTN